MDHGTSNLIQGQINTTRKALKLAAYCNRDLKKSISSLSNLNTLKYIWLLHQR